MPELPEVEVTLRRIAPALLKRQIARVKTTRPSYFFLTPPARLRAALASRTVVGLARRGKYLILTLDSGRGLLLHLGMTGQLFSSEVTSPRLLSSTARSALTPEAQSRFRPDAHTHLELHFADNGPKLYFRDVRKFGKVQLLDTGLDDPRLKRLGPDALEVRAADLFVRTRHRKLPVKSFLLDQSVLAGVGNIYADEALFLAGVRPTRVTSRLTQNDCERVVRSLRRVLRRAIESGGSSISDFIQPDGQDGHYQDERWVYARHGQACRRCNALLKRLVIGQRSTHYCPHCQR